jgi:hypothetical protein
MFLAKRTRVLNDDGLGLVLLRLVEFLGHANTIISAVSFDEVCSEY